ncbi:antibiotic biosynthesis monooxygenase [Neosynechococcus sphagnicola sy1]|uniref:Antibiotic biosynthesis monooxygenase n=1 Tax=Neosynechococcus sphagnicola sy1 TaxID=1497020 RepID=A0A098TLZ6_9CYAN|nr:putative quinol monooxygenase [Neosynechococcus sphagnicola]KGF71863.1 antibiotic biosynthesis monooxygenase [Neosynechococcus sphagnicola sy1]
MSSSMIRVLAHIVASPGKEAALQAVLLELIQPTRQESGCLAYELWQSPANPTQFVFVEAWASEAALNAHLISAHVEQAFLASADFLASPPEIYQYQLLA